MVLTAVLLQHVWENVPWARDGEYMHFATLTIVCLFCCRALCACICSCISSFLAVNFSKSEVHQRLVIVVLSVSKGRAAAVGERQRKPKNVRYSLKKLGIVREC